MGRPYVIMNAAMTLDGKIATREGDSRISCPEDLDRLHRLRARVDAILVGAGTVLSDDPSLTVRRARGRNPLRVVVDGRARIPLTARVLDGSSKTLVAVSRRAPRRKVEEGIELELRRVSRVGRDLLLLYRVKGVRGKVKRAPSKGE